MKPKPLGKTTKTGRGFDIVKFKDHNGHDCYIQESSLAIYTKPGTSALWVGVEDAKPIVMASRAASVGVKTHETTGWVPYDKIPEEVMLTTQMHLNREQVAGLIYHLQKWLDKDRL